MKKILLIGDSIRTGYDKYVKMAFENIAEVYYPNDNCRFTSYIIRYLHDWKLELDCGEDVDLIHWNVGLWDSLRMTDGELLIPIEIYKDNVERICKMIQTYFPRAKMIFATSTPVQEGLFGVLKRYNKDVEAYNEAAVEVVKRYGGGINDLYTLLASAPKTYYSDMTHFFTKEGTQLITDQVIACIERSIEMSAAKLDYDVLFADAKDVIGL